jgi:hypothetical protein
MVLGTRETVEHNDLLRFLRRGCQHNGSEHRRNHREQVFSRRFIAIAIVTISILGACASVEAENSGGYSDSSLSGTFVFRASGSSLFTSPNELTSVPVYLASVGLITFDGQGLLRGSVATSATRTLIPTGKYITPYSSQILCNAKMSGTYAIELDGTGTMTINFTPTNTGATCGASTGAFNIVILSPSQVEFVSSGQMMADPSKGEFNSYVVQGELMKRPGVESSARKR